MSPRVKLLILVILVPVLAIGVYYRVPQVAIFAAAAAFHSIGQNDYKIPHEAADGWANVAPLTIMRAKRLSGTAVTYHPEYQNYQASLASRGLKEAADLGVEYVRADVRWSAVLPDGKTPDKPAFAWYRSFFEAARAYGLNPMIVLSSPPELVRHLPKREILDRWELFVEQVVSHYGDLCVTFQVLNEPNNPIYSIFDSETLPKAVITASQIIKKRVPDAKILVNFLVDIPRWQQDAELLLSQTGSFIDVVGIDHYPGTWAFGPSAGWLSGTRMLSGIDTTVPGTPWYGRRLAIMETGFSTNVPSLRGPDQQKDFFLDLEKSLRNLGPLRNRIFFVGFYELCDSNSQAFLNPEAHFGLLKDDCATRKPAFAVAQQISLEVTYK